MLRMGSAHSKTDKGHLDCARYIMNIAQLLELLQKFLNDLKWPILGKFFKVYHLHVVLNTIRYAKKRNKYVNHYTS